MKPLILLSTLSLVLISCQPRFADPELADRTELLENRVKQLEEQLRSLRTTLATATYREERRQPNPADANDNAGTTITPAVTRQHKQQDYSESSSRSSGKNYSSGRCQATTRKGTQCKRTSRSGIYCWQHGG
jgi:hypothetical protein